MTIYWNSDIKRDVAIVRNPEALAKFDKIVEQLKKAHTVEERKERREYDVLANPVRLKYHKLQKEHEGNQDTLDKKYKKLCRQAEKDLKKALGL